MVHHALHLHILFYIDARLCHLVLHMARHEVRGLVEATLVHHLMMVHAEAAASLRIHVLHSVLVVVVMIELVSVTREHVLVVVALLAHASHAIVTFIIHVFFHLIFMIILIKLHLLFIEIGPSLRNIIWALLWSLLA